MGAWTLTNILLGISSYQAIIKKKDWLSYQSESSERGARAGRFSFDLRAIVT